MLVIRITNKLLSLNISPKTRARNASKFNSEFSNLYIYIYMLENFEYIVTKITEIYKNYCMNLLN